jgi:hypothetical protein
MRDERIDTAVNALQAGSLKFATAATARADEVGEPPNWASNASWGESQRYRCELLIATRLGGR